MKRVLLFIVISFAVTLAGVFVVAQFPRTVSTPIVYESAKKPIATAGSTSTDQAAISSTTPNKAPVAVPVQNGGEQLIASTTQTKTINKTVKTPGPLVLEKPKPVTAAPVQSASLATSSGVSTTPTVTTLASPKDALNQQDVLALTNVERSKNGLSNLKFNAQLTAMAEAKARDMIANNYFAHVSPSGVDLTALAKKYGYAYLNVGENLALGDFASSQEVVTGWMNSPGHRANILNKSYTELGVATIVGAYEGRDVWFAVQEFGRPMSDCPPPDASLKQKIILYQDQIKTLEATLANLKADIDAPGLSASEYNAKVNDYNTIVGLYNDLIETTKADIAKYNTLTDAYNTCIATPA